MPNVWFIVRLFVRLLRGERWRKATPEEWRTDGAAFGLAGLIGLLLLSLDPDVWTAPPVFLWTGVILALVPLAVFLLWLNEHVPAVRSLVFALSIPAVAIMFRVVAPQGPLPPVRVAQGGLILYALLLVLGPKTRKAG